MIIGIVGLLVTLGVGGFALVKVLEVTLMNSADAAAGNTAQDVKDLIDSDYELPDPIPVGNSAIVQVLAPDGGIMRVSPGADRLVPVLRPEQIERAVQSAEPITVKADQSTYEGKLRVHVTEVNGYTILVAVPLEDMQHSVHYFKIGLMVMVASMVVLLGLATWYVVGMSLRPVESLRKGAEEVRGAERLPLPKGSDEIHRLAVTLNSMLDRLEHARARQRAFVADAAHELRSPLANMRTELEVAARIGPTPDLLEDLLSDVDRLGRLTDDLLLLAKSDDPDRLRRRSERIDVGDMLTAITQRYTGGRVPVEFTDAESPLWVDGDVDGLRRAIGNLIDNAVRHAVSEVTVSLHPDGTGVRISVCDDGEGIPEDDRDRVFERFTRLDDARSRDKGGTGLGLPIVRELVGRHKGSVTLRDARPGARRPGLRADVWLPGV
ncbi:sensor histidine kinase [Phytomonospora endophytica]|uniref:sensor histidine kinase n=1 Tax=Phytomonospora endophytica TaxID=714109 RepID=UPI001618EC1D|nr:HAMP domain-containing sensor histidine kinase [Phytomonospora endophytica]